MNIALFDLDHTLLDGDTNILWINHLVEQGLIGAEIIARQQQYMALYAQEQLDMAEYMAFHMELLGQRRISQWQTVLREFVQAQLVPRLAPEALATLEAHRAAGHRLALVTATNSVLVGELARELNLHSISSTVEIADDRTTGRTLGLPAFREHKIARVQEWLGMPLNDPRIEASHFYSDSANDIPLLQAVSHPVAVNADAKLRALAEARGWPTRSWRAHIARTV